MRLKNFWRPIVFACWSLLLPAPAQVFTVQHTFTNTPDGSSPGQAAWMNGSFYGNTGGGGTTGNGSLFSFNTNGAAFSTFYSFTGATSSGNAPNNVLATNNMIYGTTSSGSTNGFGMIFAVGANGVGFTSLYSFGAVAPDGYSPQSGLILLGSTLYGIASSGGIYSGTNNGGAIFKIATNGAGYTILHWFTNSPDGYSPQLGELASDGTVLYGTVTSGGTANGGIIFAVNTNGGGYTILHTFTNVPDGYNPYGGVVLNGGRLYGTTLRGGTNNTGTIYAINTNGTGYKTLYSFSGFANNTDGVYPKARLFASGSWLYGTTISSGAGGGGTLFLVNTNGNGFTVLRSFTNSSAGGSGPVSGVIRNGNALWGTTASGGSGNNGVFYSLRLPAITQPPQNITVPYGDTAIFTVAAADDRAITYQWFFNTTPLAGQTNATLTLTNATDSNAGSYTVVVADSFGSVTSSPVVLAIGAAAPTITQQPLDLTVTNNTTANFTVGVSGSTPLSYQWYFNTNTPVNGGTSATLTLNPATTNQIGYYQVVVTNLYGAATSSAALLTVVIPPPVPIIIQQPQDVTVTNGYSASFTNVVSGTGPFFYQWYFNTNTALAGETNAVLTVPFAGAADGGYYTVVVSNLTGSVVSSPARLTVISTPPIIFSQPQNLAVTNGGSVNFTVLAAGQDPLKYQWYSNTVSTSIGRLLPRQTNSTYSFTAMLSANGKFYSVIVSNSLGRATSSPALLTVVTKPLITTNPQSITVNLGNPATFSVGVVALAPRYQWYSNSVSTAIGTRLFGQTNSTYTFTSITNSNGRYYSVVVTNIYGAATSTPARLTVSSLPYITLQPMGFTITNGASVTFTSTAAGPGPLAYQWLFATNAFIAGATNTVLALTNANQPGAYSMKVANSYGAVTSAPAQLVVLAQPAMLSAAFDPASGNYSFSYINLAGSTNRLWASSNLASAGAWKAIATNVMATNGLWYFTDANSAKTNAVRFYRFSTP